jgi:hypothetical protein
VHKAAPILAFKHFRERCVAFPEVLPFTLVCCYFFFFLAAFFVDFLAAFFAAFFVAIFLFSLSM